MTLRQSRRGCRGAYTLMEMLIVIIIMIILVAITLPIAKKTMEDSGPREATRQLSAFFELAKSKAVQTGRPWGIWIECEKPLAAPDYAPGVFTTVRQATKLYLAESPELYAGELLNARVQVDPSGGALGGSQGPWPLKWGQPGGPFMVQSEATLFALLTGRGPTAGPPTQRYEFFIRFNYAGPWFRGYVGPNITAVTLDTTAAYAYYIYGKAGRDRVLQNGQLAPTFAWGIQGTDDDGDGSVDEDETEYLAPGSDDIRPPFPVTGANGASFQIVRPPQRVNNSLELSSGACVDLVYSGMGRTGVEFSGMYPGYYFYDAGGQSRSFYSAIAVMFLPGGGIDSIYYVPASGGFALAPGSTYGQQNATANIHFLIGKVQKVAIPAPAPPVFGLPPSSPGNNPQYGADMFDPEKSNLMDATSFWVSIGRFNGAITTSENTPPSRVGLPVGTALPSTTHLYQYTDPSGNTSTATIDATKYDYATQGAAPPYTRQTLVEMCRTIAAGQQQMGGR